MNSHRFIEEENAMLKERIRVLEEALEIMIIGACAVGVPHQKEREVLQEAVNMAREALTPQHKE